MECLQIVDYTIPYYGNKRIFPYGRMKVEQDGETKTVKFGDIDNHGRFFIIFNRKRYYFRNIGRLHSPNFAFYEA